MSWSFKADCLNKKGVMLFMNEYEKYQLQWLMEHGYSLADFVKALIPYANEVSSIEPDANLAYCLEEGFYDFKNEGFNGDIWLSEEEWKQDLNRGNEYNLTNDGMSKVKLFIEQCKVKQESILKAGLDTAKETTLPSVEDILCNVEDMVDKNGEYTNTWSISDNYLSDPLELHKGEDFVVISNERTKDNPMNEHLIVKEVPTEARNVTVDYNDAFFINQDNATVTWIYYNPDSAAGGQYVTNILNFDEITEIAKDSQTSNEFFDRLGRIANQTLADVGTEWFLEAEIRFLEKPDFTDCTQDTMQSLISKAEKSSVIEVQTNMGSMPIEDYREIVASQSGFDSYDEMYHQGYRIGNGYDKEPEPVVPAWEQKKKVKGFDLHPDVSMAERHTFNLKENEVETVGKKERFRRNVMAIQLLKKCGLSDYTKNSQAMERPDWMKEYEILIDRDNDYVLLRDPNENVNQVWTASGKFLSTVQLENETVDEAMEEYYYNITKGGFYIPDRIKEGYMEEDYDNLSNEDIEL